MGAARRVLVIGATGGIGRRAVGALAAAGHAVSGLHRSAADAQALAAAGATPVRGNLVDDSLATLAQRMEGHDAVIFGAGAGGDRELVDEVDREGAIKAADAAERAGVGRFVLVSVFMDALRGDASPGAGFEAYMAAKRAADAHVAASTLDFLLVRPGTLTDADGTGRVSAAIALAYDEIPRVDVAAFLAAAVFAPELSRTAVELTRGDRPVAEAVAALGGRAG